MFKIKNLPKFVNYRDFRLNKLGTPEYRHLLMLLFWPVYGLVFWFLERGTTGREFHYVHAALDDVIPFCEIFVIPYYIWFVYLAGMVVYGLLFDVKAFKRYMWFIMLTYTATCVIYIIYPTAQGLRPVEFDRDNIGTRIVAMLYDFDTNTNVCPSLHVIGSVAVLFGAWKSKLFGTPAMRTVFAITTAIISVSTVFLKQHSIIDVYAGLAVSAVAWAIITAAEKLAEKKRTEVAATK